MGNEKCWNGPLKNKNHEKFVLKIIEGKSQRKAYKEVYKSAAKWKDSTVDARASELFSKILGRYNFLMEQHKEKALITREELIKGLVKGFNMALGVEEAEMAVIAFGKLTQLQARNTDLKALAKIAETIAKLEDFYPKEEKKDINIMPVINISGVKENEPD
ncbi:hypothetical protein [uncultured Ilyobacter sp.]|uniref:hypothetical protein n=1 Tax=uncultured Ilyobacter sp. TaxID=544433 RepID=UPI0029C9A877|nr:hypothetical protein [uncultured Ilyobacter sp.]